MPHRISPETKKERRTVRLLPRTMRRGHSN